MKHESWTCDACGEPLPNGEPTGVQPALVEANTCVRFHSCQRCLDAVIEKLDPRGVRRAELEAERKRNGRGAEPLRFVAYAPVRR